MSTIGLCLSPLDVLFFRDGRPFGAASRVTSGLPTPQVLAGAVRTALCERHRVPFQNALTSWVARVRFRGPWLCELPQEDGETVPEVYLPIPATIHMRKKAVEGPVEVLKVKATVPGWQGLYLPLWLSNNENTEPATGFIDSAGLTQFLQNGVPIKENLHKADDLYGFDHRTGIVVSPDRFATEEGEIYGISFLALKKKFGTLTKDFGFYAEIEPPADAPADLFAGIGLLAFGGEGKRVVVKQLAQRFQFPQVQTDKSTMKKLVLLTTPCLDQEGGIPRKLQGKIAAAAVNSPVAISGWDMAKGGPKPTQFAAPAGSVYFLNTNDPPPDLTDDLGYGCTLTGVWNDG